MCQRSEHVAPRYVEAGRFCVVSPFPPALLLLLVLWGLILWGWLGR